MFFNQIIFFPYLFLGMLIFKTINSYNNNSYAIYFLIIYSSIFYIINDPQYTNVVSDLKVQLKDLMKKSDNDKSLADFRMITDTNFGSIVDKKDDETSVQDVLTGKSE